MTAGREPVAVLGAGGTMGFPMARNLARAGIAVRAWNRSGEKAGPLAGDGVMIAGEWRPGSSGRASAGTDPWSGGTLTEIPLASADDLETAFGGTKASGIGRFGGPWAVDEFTTGHWVSVQHEPRGFPI